MSGASQGGGAGGQPTDGTPGLAQGPEPAATRDDSRTPSSRADEDGMQAQDASGAATASAMEEDEPPDSFPSGPVENGWGAPGDSDSDPGHVRELEGPDSPPEAEALDPSGAGIRAISALVESLVGDSPLGAQLLEDGTALLRMLHRRVVSTGAGAGVRQDMSGSESSADDSDDEYETDIEDWAMDRDEDSGSESSAAGDTLEPRASAGALDPGVVFQHTYLGDVGDVGGGRTFIESDMELQVPLLLLRDVVVFPGDTLPLRVCVDRQRRVVEAALTAPRPTRNVLGVINLQGYRTTVGPAEVGTLVEVTQLEPAAGGAMHLITRARARFELVSMGPRPSAPELDVTARVLPDDEPPTLPRDLTARECAHVPARLWSKVDPPAVARRVRALYAETLGAAQHPGASDRSDGVAGSSVDGLADFSFRVAMKLPVDTLARQRLLESPDVPSRLQLEEVLLRNLSALRCATCSTRISRCKYLLQLGGGEAAGGVFVNAYGYVHDMLTVTRTRHIRLQGSPETEHSWFPDYAWTIANCSVCLGHLGWRFSAVTRGCRPRVFWGLRRAAITQQSSRDAGFPEQRGDLVARESRLALDWMNMTRADSSGSDDDVLWEEGTDG
ncbi:unnamed protein product [Pedinophyceae sp. YPF-701]|nr:unnamed protein product [Pedinophyceae sp. YPF-701]